MLTSFLHEFQDCVILTQKTNGVNIFQAGSTGIQA
jgi:hypothetical protein